MTKICKGNRFIAIVKKGEYSKDCFGNECAGQEIGPFIAINVKENKGSVVRIETEDYNFRSGQWNFRKVKVRK